MPKVIDTYTALKFDEGEKLTIYPDIYNYWTVGVGHLLTKINDKALAITILDSLVGRSTKGVLTQQESEAIFQQDLDKFQKQVLQSPVLAPIFNKLDVVRQAGLLNMCFQIGVAGVESFKNSLTLIANKEYAQASVNLKKSRWYSQTTNRASRVIDTLVTGTFDSYNS